MISSTARREERSLLKSDAITCHSNDDPSLVQSSLSTSQPCFPTGGAGTPSSCPLRVYKLWALLRGIKLAGQAVILNQASHATFSPTPPPHHSPKETNGKG